MATVDIPILVILIGLYGLAWSQVEEAEFTIEEELPVSTRVASVADIPGMFSGLTDKEKNSLQYGILNQASSPASLFNISNTGGIIYVAKRIDRETLCFMMETCILKINLVISAPVPVQFTSRFVTVNFRITDVNDNAPTFERIAIVMKVSEGNYLNTTLKISGANDRDYNQENRLKNYTLNRYHDVFALATSQTLDGSSDIDLIITKSLDRETQAQYVFTITAYDGGSPSKSSTLSVTLEVTDVNDNSPVFFNSSYNVTLDSKTSLGTTILQVSASDADEGINSLVTYDFSNIQRPMLENIFRINASTGEISAVGPLRAGITEFIVEAQDSGTPRLKAQTVVRANVVNSGNAPPRVSITKVGASSDQDTVSILEPGGRGMFVAFAQVEDDDDVACQITSDIFRLEYVPNRGYQVVLQGLVDREATASYDLTVTCTDTGNPPLNTTVQMTVQIEDANDNSPIFTQHRYTRTMLEGNKRNEFVLQVSASDKDVGANAQVRYSIDPGYSHYFNIDPDSGVLTAVGNLDREQTPAISFKVYATDQGKPEDRNASVDVYIVLDDINDNAPVLASKVFTFTTVEEQEGSRIIGSLEARDADDGANGEVEFFYTGSLDGADGEFSVLPNGSVISSSRLDREERVNYSFSVMARDKGEPPLMTTGTVVVKVTDINDHSPAILFPKSPNHTIVISMVPEADVVISRVIAYDDDEGDNGSLRFAIVSGNEDSAFEISDSTGEFKIAQASRLKNRKQYDVGIMVADKGIPPKVNTTSLKIEIVFDNSTQVAKGVKGKGEDYIIIVAVVAAVTVIFSTLIIAAICVVFQKDRSVSRKPTLKPVFQNVHCQESVSDAEKIVSHDHISTKVSSHQFTLNDLSSTPAGHKSTSHDHTFLQLQGPQPDCPNSSKMKAVTFSLSDPEMGSPAPRYSSSRNDFPPFLTFGASFGGSSNDDAFRPPSSMTRQGDDVISDTSGDTNTSDSGRGNSVDDVTFDQTLASDHSSGLNFRRHSDELQKSTDKTIPTENERRGQSHHVRFLDTQTNNFSQTQPTKQHPTAKYNGTRPSTGQIARFSSKDGNVASKGFSNPLNYHNSISQRLTTFGVPGRLSVTSADDDATTTTSGSYVINPDEIRMDSYIGADIIV